MPISLPGCANAAEIGSETLRTVFANATFKTFPKNTMLMPSHW